MQQKNPDEEQSPAPYKLVAPYATDDPIQNSGESAKSAERASRSLPAAPSAPYATDTTAEQHAAQAAALATVSYIPVPPDASEASEAGTKLFGDVLAPFATADPDILLHELNLEDVSEVFNDQALDMPPDEMAPAVEKA